MCSVLTFHGLKHRSLVSCRKVDNTVNQRLSCDFELLSARQGIAAQAVCEKRQEVGLYVVCMDSKHSVENLDRVSSVVPGDHLYDSPRVLEIGVSSDLRTPDRNKDKVELLKYGQFSSHSSAKNDISETEEGELNNICTAMGYPGTSRRSVSWEMLASAAMLVCRSRLAM